MDNTNPTVAERKRYIEAAKKARFEIIDYFFYTSVDEAIERNSRRTGKEAVPYIGIRGTFKKLQPPSPNEGFDVLYEVMISNGTFDVKKRL